MERGWLAIPFLVVVFFSSSSFSLESCVIRKGSFGASFSNFILRLGIIRVNETHLVMYIKNISLLFSTPRNNIYIYIYICVCVFYTCIYIHTYMHAYIHTYVYVCIRVHVCVSMYVWVHENVQLWIKHNVSVDL